MKQALRFSEKMLRTGCSQNMDICLYWYHGFQGPDRVQAGSLILIFQGVTGFSWL